MNILHWVTDDKFIDDLISVMEYTKGKHNHVYAIITDNDSRNFIYIKKKEFIKIIHPSDLIATLNHYDVIVLHGLRAGVFDFINKMPHGIKIVWSAWGYDLYSIPNKRFPFIKLRLYKPYTKRAIHESMRKRLEEFRVTVNYMRHRQEIERAISRINYFSSVIPQEYELMQKNPFFKAKQVGFHYISLDDVVSEENLGTLLPIGNDILVGNSGDPANNHLDIFEYLRHIDIAGSKVYVPLNYGGTEAYREKVKSVGKEYWGENFVALDSFLPYQKYYKIISSCGNVIMFHERQQAMGNIRQGVWNGCKVFLSDSGLAYKFHKSLGLKVFSVQEELTSEWLKMQLSSVDIKLNRTKMINSISRTCLLNDIYHMYEILES